MSGSIWITLGDRKELGIDEDGHLKLKHFASGTYSIPPEHIDLGKATKARIDNLIGFLEQLRIHHV